MRQSRRELIAGVAASLCAGAAFAADRLAAIEARVRGRLGLAALDTANGARLIHRADERFPMCSTFKAMAAAAVLKRVDDGVEDLDRVVRYTEADLLGYAPTTRAHVKEGGLSVDALCQAAVELSDNTAANLILASIGGPAGWTRYVSTLGDDVSRLDRTETALNTSLPGDPRDTTTPNAMLADLGAAVLGPTPFAWLPARRREHVSLDVLGPGLLPPSRERLTNWLLGCQTGRQRLRAGLPSAWRVGDKTGTWSGENPYASANDIAVVFTPTKPILICCYITGADAVSGAVRDSAIAEVGRLVAHRFRPREAPHG